LPYKNPEDQAAYMAAYRKKKGKAASTAKKKLELKGVAINTAEDLKKIVAASLYELVDTPMEPGQRGRCIAQLIGAAVKLLEVGSIEERLTKLETKML
jgi:hypothetical protein